jgi:hypothetical protein
MKITLNRNRHRQGVIGCIMALLVIVVCAIIIWKLITFCQQYLPPTPPPDQPTNGLPTNLPPNFAAFIPLWTNTPGMQSPQPEPTDGPGFYVDYLVLDDGVHAPVLLLTNICVAVPRVSADNSLAAWGLPDLTQQTNWLQPAFASEGANQSEPTNVAISNGTVSLNIAGIWGTAYVENGQLSVSGSGAQYTVVIESNTNSPFAAADWLPVFTNTVPVNTELTWKDTNDPATNAHCWYRGRFLP